MKRRTSSAVTVVTIAAAIGLTTAIFSNFRTFNTLMFGITTRDPATFAAAAVVLIATSLAGTYLPARRAARSNFKLLTSDFSLQTSHFRPQTSDFRLQTSDF
jgi:hypothetical protein